MVIIGLDIGTKRIGVAQWSPSSRIVTPVGTIHVDKPIKAYQALIEIIDTQQPTAIVLGYPLMPNGQPGELARLVDKWHTRLESHCDIPIKRWDERMTSKRAEQDLTTLGLSHKEQRHVVDVAAAMHILDSWLQAQGHIQ